MIRSLRTRLALTIILIGALGLTAMSIAVARFVASDLQRRQDLTLRSSAARIAEGRFRDLIDPDTVSFAESLLPGTGAATTPITVTLKKGSGVIPPPQTGRSRDLVGEIYAELRDTDDKLLDTPRVFQLGDEQALTLALPEQLPVPDESGVAFSVHSKGESAYRVLYKAITTPDGQPLRLLTAISRNNQIETLDRLGQILLISSAGVLAAIGLAAWSVARLGLRPVRRIEQAASTIAGGDLSHRIDDVDRRSEIGRLGASLNQMMGTIETAFAERAEAAAQLQRFVADASHELRTPLTAIRGHAQLQQRMSDVPIHTLGALGSIDAASQRMQAIVENLLLLARTGAGATIESEPVDVGAVVRTVVSDARAAHVGRTISLDLAREMVAMGDMDRLHQSVANLVENALRYTPGAVEVRVLRHDEDIRVEVGDDGPGVAEEHLAHLLEPFYRVDPGRSRATGGSGLGLAIAHANVAAMGGRIEIVSDVERGSVFSIVLSGLRCGSPVPPAVGLGSSP